MLMNGVRRFWIAYSVESAWIDPSARACGRLECESTVTLTLHHLELPRPAGRHPDVSRMSRLHDVVQRLHGLLDLLVSATQNDDWESTPYRSVWVEPVALEDQHVLCLQVRG